MIHSETTYINKQLKKVLILEILSYTFFYKQSIFDPRPAKCLCFSKQLPQKFFSNCLVDGLLTSIA